MPEGNPESDESEGLVGNAVIVACVIGIVIVAALIVLTPRGSEPFTQLWLKPWKLNLTNLTPDDPILDVLAPEADDSSIATSSVFGIGFYVNRLSLQVGLSTDLLATGPHLNFAECFSRSYSAGDTIWLGNNALYLDAIDGEGYQILFFEYPKFLYSRRVRFAFVIENNLGEDHEYLVNVSLAIANVSTAGKVLQTVKVDKGRQKTCVVEFPLSGDEVTPILGPAAQNAKITVQLDTGEEVFFWIGSPRE